MLEAVSAGVPLTQACIHAGISESAHFRAMEAGEAAQEDLDDGIPIDDRADSYREYRERVLRARARVAVVNVALVAKAARGGAVVKETVRRYERENADGETVPVEEREKEYAPPQWKAAQFLLQTSFSQDFRVTSRQEHTGADGGPMAVEHSSPGEDALTATADRIAEVFRAQSEQLPGGWERPADGVLVIEGEAGPARVALEAAPDSEGGNA